MTTQHEKAKAGSAPAGGNEAGIMSDWTKVVALIGAHPDLRLDELGASGAWIQRGCQALDVQGQPYRDIWYPATPATVDGLMLAHATAWLDERGLDVMRNDGGRGFFIDAYDAGDELWDRAQAIQSEEYPTRKAAVIAAVVAAAEGGSK